MSDPGRQWKRVALVFGGLFVIAVLAMNMGNMGRENWPVQFQSNGERIYFTGMSSSGTPITSTGGTMHMQMHLGGCANCHGADRQGGRLMPKFWKVAPPLTPAALFKKHDEGSKDDGHGDHGSYSDTALRRAITKGQDPENKQLDPAMPRWSMSEQDLTDLINFLKSPARG